MSCESYERLARLVVRYSLDVQPGETVCLSGLPATHSLLMLLMQETLRAGGLPVLRVAHDLYRETRLRFGQPGAHWHNPLGLEEGRPIACSAALWCQTGALRNDDEPLGPLALSDDTGLHEFGRRVAAGAIRWTGIEFPTEQAASEASLPLGEYEQLLFRAARLDEPDPARAWRAVALEQQGWCDYLNQAHEIRVTSPRGTDLTFAVTGRHWLNCAGRLNLPDGEVFTAPLEDSISGLACFDGAAEFHNRRLREVRLRFKHGRVVEASAAEGARTLDALLAVDDGARRIGEFALGMNERLTRFTGNELLDEKMAGTFHIALGAAYPQTGGINESAIHCDFVADLRSGGCVFVDGRLITENGLLIRPP